jgi:hypothetical protein
LFVFYNIRLKKSPPHTIHPPPIPLSHTNTIHNTYTNLSFHQFHQFRFLGPHIQNSLNATGKTNNYMMTAGVPLKRKIVEDQFYKVMQEIFTTKHNYKIAAIQSATSIHLRTKSKPRSVMNRFQWPDWSCNTEIHGWLKRARRSEIIIYLYHLFLSLWSFLYKYKYNQMKYNSTILILLN